MMTLIPGILLTAALGIAAIVADHCMRRALHAAYERGEKRGFLEGVKSERRFTGAGQ